MRESVYLFQVSRELTVDPILLVDQMKRDFRRLGDSPRVTRVLVSGKLNGWLRNRLQEWNANRDPAELEGGALYLMGVRVEVSESLCSWEYGFVRGGGGDGSDSADD